MLSTGFVVERLDFIVFAICMLSFCKLSVQDLKIFLKKIKKALDSASVSGYTK